MEARSVRIAWKIIMIPHVLVLFFGLMMTLAPDAVVGSDFESFMGQSWAAFVTSSPKLAFFVSLLGIVLGANLVVIGILAIAATLKAFRRGEKWSWYVFLLGNTIGWGSGIAMEGISGAMLLVAVEVVCLLLAYIALAISAKSILSKKSS